MSFADDYAVTKAALMIRDELLALVISSGSPVGHRLLRQRTFRFLLTPIASPVAQRAGLTTEPKLVLRRLCAAGRTPA